MNGLDRMIKRERNKRVRYLKKLFKSRDMASKYIKRVVRISEVAKNLRKSRRRLPHNYGLS